MFSLARDWSKCVTWANIPHLKLGNIEGYNPSNIFARARLV